MPLWIVSPSWHLLAGTERIALAEGQLKQPEPWKLLYEAAS